ncbi:MAG TPA: alpha/beta fold hydrolase [Pirellulales bacterium]|nr:alpha/beta fold hydrolase [Pirellulales bacterium]
MPEIVEATTRDGIRLHGALYRPDEPPTTAAKLDAVLLLHGAGGNFYGSTLFGGLLPMFAQLGLSVLVVNTRGHDGVSTAASANGPRVLGAAYELVDDCRHDLAAWLDSLDGRGFKRLVIAGHSLGAVKAIYTLAQEERPNVRALVAISPPRLSHSRFADGPESEQFLGEFAEAQRLVAAGQGETLMSIRFPIPYLVTAAGYIDKYGRDERYNVLKHVSQVACPMLFTFGTIELRRGSAFQGLPDELTSLAEQGADVKVAVLAGADHFYTAARGELAAQVGGWLRRLPAAE